MHNEEWFFVTQDFQGTMNKVRKKIGQQTQNVAEIKEEIETRIVSLVSPNFKWKGR